MVARSSSWLASGGSTGTAPARAVAEAKLMAKRQATHAAKAKPASLVVAAEKKSCERPGGTGESPETEIEVNTSDEDVAGRSGMVDASDFYPDPVPRPPGKGSGKPFVPYQGFTGPPRISPERVAQIRAAEAEGDQAVSKQERERLRDVEQKAETSVVLTPRAEDRQPVRLISPTADPIRAI